MLEARLEELMQRVDAEGGRRRRRGGGGGGDGGGRPPIDAPAADAPALSVGDRVRLRPGADQRGCLRGDRIGRLVESDGSEVPYKCEYQGDTYWYYARDIVAAPPEGAPPAAGGAAGAPGGAHVYARGDRVRIVGDVATAERQADGFGGWNPTMAEYCGREGVVAETRRSGAVQVTHDSGRSWYWNPESLEPLAGGGVVRRPTTGDRVCLAPGVEEPEGCIGSIGAVGTIVQDDHSRMPFQVRGLSGTTRWYRENQVVLALPGAEPAGAGAAAARFRVGDPVTVIADVAQCRRLADGHGYNTQPPPQLDCQEDP